MKAALALLCGSLLLLTPPARAAGEPKLQNAGFESGQDGWALQVYGAKPTIETDEQIVHEGKRSLRITAADPSDTALSQELRLKPGQLYRLSGWVRTRGLGPRGAPVYGTFQIQNPGGRGTIAGGASHGGDCDWTQETIYFEAPAGGLTRVVAFFVGFGKGTGTAWFDDLRLEPVDASKAPLKVTRDFLHASPINPMQYGQFIEYLCDLVPGMWAEKLYDGSFEGLTPYKFAYLRATDFREKPWYPSGATNRAEYTLDRHDPVSGAVSQKIAAGAAPRPPWAFRRTASPWSVARPATSTVIFGRMASKDRCSSVCTAAARRWLPPSSQPAPAGRSSAPAWFRRSPRRTQDCPSPSAAQAPSGSTTPR